MYCFSQKYWEVSLKRKKHIASTAYRWLFCWLTPRPRLWRGYVLPISRWPSTDAVFRKMERFIVTDVRTSIVTSFCVIGIYDCLDNVGSSTSHNSMGVYGRLRWYLYFLIRRWCSYITGNITCGPPWFVTGIALHFLYVDGARTSQETHLWTSVACYKESSTFLYADDVRISQETHVWASTARYRDKLTFRFVRSHQKLFLYWKTLSLYETVGRLERSPFWIVCKDIFILNATPRRRMQEWRYGSEHF
jgi:hypothetical protein